jgi:hypothetical protein
MSPSPVELGLSPFAECGRTISTIGYRNRLTGQVVASVEIPSELIESTVLAKISVEVVLSGDGQIASTANSAASACPSARKTISVDKLVEAFLDNHNLHMEEATERELRALLERLQKSVHAVQRSIAVLQRAIG